jgi:hypothetical protein
MYRPFVLIILHYLPLHAGSGGPRTLKMQNNSPTYHHFMHYPGSRRTLAWWIFEAAAGIARHQ